MIVKHRHKPRPLRVVLFASTFMAIFLTALTIGGVMKLSYDGDRHDWRAVQRDDGRMEYCHVDDRRPPWRGAIAFGSAVLVLWALAGAYARKATRPLLHLADVARKIGAGDLNARPNVMAHRVSEIRDLADAIHEMAERIEKQMRDQRALLAGASHELRTPLGHLRILMEMLRERKDDKTIDEVERELVEMDALVGKLLAQSRLDFSMVEKRSVDAIDLARRALERAGLSSSLLKASEHLEMRADPTLVLGALGNVIENARDHGGGAVALVVEDRGDAVAFFVEDNGPGIPEDDLAKVFEPFFHQSKQGRGSLGLGLHLVQRIAEAHGGKAIAERRPAGGARVGFTIAR
jgi:two-component system, OmpR family, sensor kinase